MLATCGLTLNKVQTALSRVKFPQMPFLRGVLLTEQALAFFPFFFFLLALAGFLFESALSVSFAFGIFLNEPFSVRAKFAESSL